MQLLDLAFVWHALTFVVVCQTTLCNCSAVYHITHTHTHTHTIRTDSMYDYVYSPGHSVSGDTDNGDADELTEPSTPSSCHPTPDLHGSVFSGLCENGATAGSPRPRSATIPDMLVTVPSYDTSTLPAPKSAADVLSPKMSTSLPRQSFTFPNDKQPPPLPPRDATTMGTLKKNKATTQSQPFLEDTAKLPGTLKREGEARRLSNSMDCLLLPEEDGETNQLGNGFNKLEAEPYLRPSEVKQVMAAPADRNSSVFMSMRVSGKSRPQLPSFQASFENPETMKRSKSFEKGHKRSQSNPFILELMADGVPPELPPRNTELPPPVPSRSTPQHRASRSPPPGSEETFESSLEFGNPTSGGRILLPGRTTGRARSPQAVVRDLKEHTLNSLEEDNISTISGPFEEIDVDQSSMATEGTGLVRDISAHTLPPQQQDGHEDDENDQYARIEDITHDQQYIAMAPAPVNMKGATLPAQRISYLSADDLDEEEGGGKRAKSVSQVSVSGTPKKDSGVLARTVRRFRKQRTEPIVRESTDSPSPPPSTAHSFASSISTSLLASPNRHSLPRPLPPSPTKGLKPQFNPATQKQSSGAGSNIYETIDEDLLNRVRGKPRRQGSTKDENLKSSWAPPVDPKMWHKYLEVIQKFFSLPEIQEKWVETVREVMPDEDADDIPPPYYKTEVEPGSWNEEQPSNLLSIKSSSNYNDGDNDEQIPILVPEPEVSTPTFKASPAVRRAQGSPHQSPFQSPRHTDMIKSEGGPQTNTPRIKRESSRDELIELMNQQLHHNQASSDSETDSDEETGVDEEEEVSSDSDTTDSDIEHTENDDDELRKPTATPHTDLDEAFGVQNSLNTDSDHIETDPVIKSPQSASIEELDREQQQGEISQGVVEDHCVKPSKFLLKLHQKATSDLKVGGGSRSLSDSGISNQNFEDNNQSETEC